ncbi:catabolite gene activator protein [Spirochaetia bacterium]|nr:catabolite gene activator protein [Spirochaetia bacterium]
MPQPLQFGTGSLVYLQGDSAEKVFLLQTGTISLVYQDIETAEDVHDSVQPGEFFGVKSALGRFPREENAIVLQDSTIMAFTVPEFEGMVMKNTRIIMKILKVFSNQLRRIHKQTSVLTATEEKNPETGLFNIGDYFLTNKRYALAISSFSRYLTYYPSGRNAALAAKKLEIAMAALNPQGDRSGAAAPVPFAVPGPSARIVKEEIVTDSAKAYYNAISLISQEKYQSAYVAFKKIADSGADAEYAAKSAFEMGRCLYFLNRYEDCIRYFSGMISKYPRHPELEDTLYFIGQSHEKSSRKEQAAVFYKKVISMISDEGNGTRVRAVSALKALGA